MAYKTLIFGVDDMFNQLKPFYNAQVQSGTLEIVAYAVFEKNRIHFVNSNGSTFKGNLNFDIAIISSTHDFYNRMKFLESKGVPRKKIVDGRVFKVPQLNVPRLLAEGVAYGVFEDSYSFSDTTNTIYPRVYTFKNVKAFIRLGIKSRINGRGNFPGQLEVFGRGLITFGNFSGISWGSLFELGLNEAHNYSRVSFYSLTNLDWIAPDDFYPKEEPCKILIGNDVWIGRGVILKSNNPDKPLIIGDGAVVASDSVVVKDVPPYAIVGGNPAKIIKYRFPPDVIESLLRIKWWDWSLEKIHDNFQYFNDIEKFISLHDA